MARKPLQPIKSVEDFTFNMLVHGIPNSGKTHFLGDFLRTEAQHGEVKYLNIAGEDYNTVPDLPGETIETFKDFEQVLAEWAKQGLQAVGLDSFHRFCDLVMTAQFGDRLPKTGSNSENEWSEYHFRMRNETNKLRLLAKRVVVSCMSDRYMDPVTQEPARINPDLPGRQSRDALGRFTVIGYLETRLMGPGKLKRTLMLAPNNKVITRTNLPNPILEDVDIPHGGGGWANFMTAVQKAMQGGK